MYQLHHPWHWLTYGNNANALAGVAAVLGLIGLFRYVRYTKSIMNATLSSLEGSLYPVLMVESFDYSEHFVHFKISNVGRGPALNVAVWRIEEGNDAPSLFRKRQTLPIGERATIYGTLRPDHDKSESFEIRYPFATGEESFIVIVDAADVNGNAHQLQILGYGKDSSKGYLLRECVNIPPDRNPRCKKQKPREFVHGKGFSPGVDLNLQNIDGSPVKKIKP